MMEFYFFTGVFCLQFLLIIFFLWAYYSLKIKPKNNIVKLSVVIPFRNEADQISGLINALNNGNFPEGTELIFVSDHSEDNTLDIIRKMLKIPYKMHNLDEQRGKKHAIDLGVQNAQNDYILTLDADVEFENDFLTNISNAAKGDLVILPVNMAGKNLNGKLSSFEFKWLQLLTFGSLKLNNPLLCNGANLLFKKKAYQDLRANRRDFEIPSGDDIFLLCAMKKDNRNISGLTNPELAVTTSAPATFKTLLQQRKRWAGKMTSFTSFPIILSALFVFLVEIGLIYSVFFSFYNVLFFIPIGIKFTGEYILHASFPRKENLFLLFLLTILHQAWYILYLLGLMIPIKMDRKWKH